MKFGLGTSSESNFINNSYRAYDLARFRWELEEYFIYCTSELLVDYTYFKYLLS